MEMASEVDSIFLTGYKIIMPPPPRFIKISLIIKAIPNFVPQMICFLWKCYKFSNICCTVLVQIAVHPQIIFYKMLFGNSLQSLKHTVAGSI